ncbi:MAG: DNA-binding domain-containing protein [Bdellovibrionota bacterium]
MRPETLEKIQHRFWSSVTGPEGVEPEAKKLAAQDPGAHPVSNWIVGESPDVSTRRLDVYAGMYFERLASILEGDFAKILEIVGSESFRTLAREYLTAHPSTNPSVRYIGERLPDFLKAHALAESFPYLPDLAKLEWARNEVFDRQDAKALSAEDIQAVPLEKWDGLIFEPIPSLRVLSLEYPAHELWLALEEKKDIPEISPAPVKLLVWRVGFKVYHRPLEASEAPLLEAIFAGKTFSEACESAAQALGEDIQAAAERAAVLLARWVREGIFARVRIS